MNHVLPLAGGLFVLAVFAAAAEPEKDGVMTNPPHIVIADLDPRLDGQEVTMAFTIADEYMISGSVPVGQVPSFGIRPKLDDDENRFSVLVSGDLADLMYRFGLGADVNRAKGVVIQATGKITVFPALKDATDQRPSYQLNIRDWQKFRIVPDPKKSIGA
ncbi:MAG: hypothetical protein R3C01_13115 [Planctomycetaceae bacterium]